MFTWRQKLQTSSNEIMLDITKIQKSNKFLLLTASFLKQFNWYTTTNMYAFKKALMPFKSLERGN